MKASEQISAQNKSSNQNVKSIEWNEDYKTERTKSKKGREREIYEWSQHTGKQLVEQKWGRKKNNEKNLNKLSTNKQVSNWFEFPRVSKVHAERETQTDQMNSDSRIVFKQEMKC